jgi:diguanylate cyclase (GGDEF)-like protein/hemerythrin-like metal-binding protein/PAS domain S-box-containing protein
LEVNDAYCNQSGYRRDELLSLCIPDLEFIEKPEEITSRIQRIVRNGPERFVSVHWAKNQRRWPVEVVASYSPTGGGRLYCFIKDLTEQQHSAQLIWHQANFDQLTDLPNRALFFDRLTQECSSARRSGKQVALLFADLDAFKPVNDQYGHDAGDVALQTVASRWLSCVRQTDTVARLGGDEFAIILGGVDSPMDATRIAEKIIASMEAKIILPHNRACALGVSLGIAMYPQNAMELDSLLSEADKAMYASKAGGKNRFVFSDCAAAVTPQKAEWLVFKESDLVGVAEIDAQHRQLVCFVNDINRAISSNDDQSKVDKLLDGLLKFTMHHFLTEHGFMQKYHYPNMQAHDREHAKLTGELGSTIQKFGSEGDLLVLQKIKDWLIAHIRDSDIALGRFLNGAGVY